MQFTCDCPLNRVSCQPLVCKRALTMEELERRIEELERQAYEHFIPNEVEVPKACPSCGQFPPNVCMSTNCPYNMRTTC